MSCKGYSAFEQRDQPAWARFKVINLLFYIFVKIVVKKSEIFLFLFIFFVFFILVYRAFVQWSPEIFSKICFIFLYMLKTYMK